MRHTARRLWFFGLVAATLTPIGCSNVAADPATSVSCTTVEACPADIPSRDALSLLDSLRVAGRAPKTGYDRDKFGPAWTDDVSVPFGHNGCDTRNDILKRDLHELTYKPNTRDCIVATGTLDDDYTNKTIHFVRGQGTSDDVQVDHIVALSDAWQKGAQKLSDDRRRDLANDPLNLQAVDGPTNQSKGDSDAATWLPPNKNYRCAYLTRQIQVKSVYELWVTEAEKDAMARELSGCP